MQNRKVDDVIDADTPKPIEALFAAAKMKVPEPRKQYKFHHTVTCMTTPGLGICSECKYALGCVNGITEWDETVP
jgi:hypothetical protein